MQFERLLREDIPKLMPYYRNQKTKISNYTLSFLFMWFRHQNAMYAFAGDCLIVREKFVNMPYFHYPLSLTGEDTEAEGRALDELEKYCREHDERLHFTNVPAEKLCNLVARYGTELHISNPRRWRDYLYEAEDFKEYPGGKYSGQRNHVNKFNKEYPDHEFCVYEEKDLPEALAFLEEYAAGRPDKDSFSATEEMKAVAELLPHLFELGLCCGFMRAGGKMVSFSVGERCADMMVVVVEKALKEYRGAYPATAQMFARTFCGEGIRYLNREDDAGDIGLRKSKLQYLPCRLVDKYNLVPHRAIDSLSYFPETKTKRLEIRGMAEEDAAAYARFARDVRLNRYWGYDWRDDAPEDVSDEWFYKEAISDFRKKEEVREGIYFEGALIGEVVLHNFGYRGEAEIGVRLLPEMQGRGFAREALMGMMEYAFSKLSLDRIEAKCFKENAPSERALLSAGMRRAGEDEQYFYFYKTAAM